MDVFDAYNGQNFYDAAYAARASYDTKDSHTRYYTRYFLHKIMSVFDWNLPDFWDANYFMYVLYTRGFVCITDVPGKGVIPQHCTINGYNVFYNPSTALINNPNIPFEKEVKLGKTGELVMLTPDFRGVLDTVYEHAEMMANASAAVNLNLFNSRASYVFWAQNRAQAESYQKMYDEISAGLPAVFVDKRLATVDAEGKLVQPYQPFNADIKSNYVADQVLDDMIKIEQAFARKIGIPTTNTTKRERMTQDETNKGDLDAMSNVTVWTDTLDVGVSRVNKLYPELNISYKPRFADWYIPESNMTNLKSGENNGDNQ